MAQLSFDASVSQQQRQWVNDAILAASMFELDRLNVDIVVTTVTEPPCAGHNDYMCTLAAGGGATIFIRVGADDPNADFNRKVRDRLHEFFMEAFIHELGHVLFFTSITLTDVEKAGVARLFTMKAATGEVARTGVLEDWNPLDKPWEQRISEGVAEFFKDLYLPREKRVYDNRSDWWMTRGSFDAFMTYIETVICPPA